MNKTESNIYDFVDKRARKLNDGERKEKHAQKTVEAERDIYPISQWLVFLKPALSFH